MVAYNLKENTRGCEHRADESMVLSQHCVCNDDFITRRAKTK
jgi:hypothetical protein